MSDLPPNVYHIAQRRFDAIPRAPWVYWIPEALRKLFESLPSLGQTAEAGVGQNTGDNFRFLRCWWEVGPGRIGLGCRDWATASRSGKRWFPYMKGGRFRRWFGNQTSVVDWHNDGRAIKAYAVMRNHGRHWSRYLQNLDLCFREGITYSFLTTAVFSARYSPGGFIFDVAGSSVFPSDIFLVLAVLNSKPAAFMLKVINPTVNFQVGDLRRLPVPDVSTQALETFVAQSIRLSLAVDKWEETTYHFAEVPLWDRGDLRPFTRQSRLEALQSAIDDEMYDLYAISDQDRTAIQAELAGESLVDDEEDEDGESLTSDDDLEEPEAIIAREELAVRWISYAVGIVLGRFQPGVAGELGSAVNRRSEYALGSLPQPEEAEFDELVGPPERFAYIDAEGGRHVFSAEVETALRTLAVPDGIAVLDDGHPRDLVGLVEQALRLMLDGVIDDLQLTIDDSASANRQSSISNRKSDEVVQVGAGGDLRKFLERDFFTKWHLRWYRKRPVYWPLQSSRRSYGFVLFHERIDRMTLYTLQRDYLDVKLNGLRLEIGDLRGQAEGQSGAARRRIERQIDQVTQLLDEVSEFAKTMARIVSEGYEPEPNWIDDGVILRMAPLWELVPIWKAEPRKYWERLQKGDYDWSHIAMHYWPKRVKAACKTDKSFAIAHGHEEWYRGSG